MKQAPKKHERMEEFVRGLDTDGDPDFHACYTGYFLCFNEGRYYEAHDVLEHLWLQTDGRDFGFYKGLIQFAGAFVHLQKQHERPSHPKDGRRLAPACRLFVRASELLAPFAPLHHRLAVGDLLDICRRKAAFLELHDYQRNPWHPEAMPQLVLLAGAS